MTEHFLSKKFLWPVNQARYPKRGWKSSLAEEVLDKTIVLPRTSLAKKNFCRELSRQKKNSFFYLENAQL